MREAVIAFKRIAPQLIFNSIVPTVFVQSRMSGTSEDDYDLKPFLTSVHARTSRRIVQKYFENQIENIEQHGLYARYVDTFVKYYELSPVPIDPKNQNPLV